MITIKEYLVPKTIGEAYNSLTSKKNSVLFGGGAFIRMGSKNIGTAIDLSKAELDYIRDTDNTFEIGAMTTFGDIERSDELKNYFNGVLPISVKDIVGVQLRNLVTVGGTVFSRYGFSDLITGLLALDTKVKLYKEGIVSLEEFLDKGTIETDILESIIITKDSRKAVFKSMRNSKGDYAILNLSLSKIENEYKVAVGARPQRATLAYKTMKYLNNNDMNNEAISKACDIIAEELVFGSNSRASEKYRKEICKVLLKRAFMEVNNYED